MLELKIVMLRRGMTGRWLAEQLGISESYFSEILRNRKKANAIREQLVYKFGFPRCAVWPTRSVARKRSEAKAA